MFVNRKLRRNLSLSLSLIANPNTTLYCGTGISFVKERLRVKPHVKHVIIWIVIKSICIRSTIENLNKPGSKNRRKQRFFLKIIRQPSTISQHLMVYFAVTWFSRTNPSFDSSRAVSVIIQEMCNRKPHFPFITVICLITFVNLITHTRDRQRPGYSVFVFQLHNVGL